MSQTQGAKESFKLEPVTEELFRERYKYEEEEIPPLKKRIRAAMRCTSATWLNLIPIARWLPSYSAQNDLLNDVISGLMVAIMHIPHGLSYSSLAMVDPIVGLYMAVFPVFIYMIMGTSRHISLGTFAVVCAMVGSLVVENHGVIPNILELKKNASKLFPKLEVVAPKNETLKTEKYTPLQIASSACLFVGIWQTLLGVFKLGIVMVVMSDSVISGFTTGAACHVFSYQLKNLFGVDVQSPTGALKLYNIYIDFFSKIKTTNLMTLAISVCSIAVLIIFNDFVKPLMIKRWPKNRVPVPIELFIIVIGTGVSYFTNISEIYKVHIVGYIPQGLPAPRIPEFPPTSPFIFRTLVIAIVALAVNLSLAKIFAKKANYNIDDNQELLAYGAANIFSSFFLCAPSAASLSRSSIQFSMGGKTQLTSIFGLSFVMLVILFAAPLFECVPYCVLSAIVVVTLKGLLLQLFDIPEIWKKSYLNGIVWTGTFVAVIVFDIDIGLGIGIALSLLSIIFTSLMYKVNVMGRVPNENIYLDLKHYKTATSLPKILILQIMGNINFANCHKLEEQILKEFKNFSTFSMEDESFVILNLEGVFQIDPTTGDVLQQLNAYFNESKSQMFLTNCNIKVYAAFEKWNFFTHFPKTQVFATVSDAVTYLMGAT